MYACIWLYVCSVLYVCSLCVQYLYILEDVRIHCLLSGHKRKCAAAHLQSARGRVGSASRLESSASRLCCKTASRDNHATCKATLGIGCCGLKLRKREQKGSERWWTHFFNTWRVRGCAFEMSYGCGYGSTNRPENRIFGSLLITGFHFDQLRLVGWKLS